MKAIRVGNILITPHAKSRIDERIGISDRKLGKFVRKALERPESESPKLNRKVYNTEMHHIENSIHPEEKRIIKELMGFVFIFSVKEKNGRKQFHLVTVL